MQPINPYINYDTFKQHCETFENVNDLIQAFRLINFDLDPQAPKPIETNVFKELNHDEFRSVLVDNGAGNYICLQDPVNLHEMNTGSIYHFWRTVHAKKINRIIIISKDSEKNGLDYFLEKRLNDYNQKCSKISQITLHNKNVFKDFEVKKIFIKNKTISKNQIEVNIFRYLKWNNTENIPENIETFLNFMNEVKSNVYGDYSGKKIVVHDEYKRLSIYLLNDIFVDLYKNDKLENVEKVIQRLKLYDEQLFFSKDLVKKSCDILIKVLEKLREQQALANESFCMEDNEENENDNRDNNFEFLDPLVANESSANKQSENNIPAAPQPLINNQPNQPNQPNNNLNTSLNRGTNLNPSPPSNQQSGNAIPVLPPANTSTGQNTQNQAINNPSATLNPGSNTNPGSTIQPARNFKPDELHSIIPNQPNQPYNNLNTNINRGLNPSTTDIENLNQLSKGVKRQFQFPKLIQIREPCNYQGTSESHLKKVKVNYAYVPPNSRKVKDIKKVNFKCKIE